MQIWLLHINDFIEEAIEEGGDNIHLVNLDVLTKNGEYEECLPGYRFRNGGERLLVIDAILLLVAISYLSSFVLEYIAKAILL